MNTDSQYKRRFSEKDKGEEEDESRGRGEDGGDITGINDSQRTSVHVVGGSPDEGERDGGREEREWSDSFLGEEPCTVAVEERWVSVK